MRARLRTAPYVGRSSLTFGADTQDAAALEAFAAAFPSSQAYDDGPAWKGAYWESRSRERSEREVARTAQRRAERAASGPGHNLEDVTLEPQTPSAVPDLIPGGTCADGQPALKVTQYPDGLRVVVFQSRSRASAGSASRAAKSSEPSEAVSTAERSESSLSRSRALVAHRARCLGATAMWTFTKRGKFSSADEVWKAWRAFTKIMRIRYKKKFRYVAVPELHQDGETWHLHVLVDRYYMASSLRVLWYRALGGTGREQGEQTPGSVNAKSLRNGRFGARRAARYIAKYVGKGFERCGANRRVFGASCGLNPISVERRRISYDCGIVAGLDIAREWIRATYPVEWFGARFVFRPLWHCALADVSFR